MPIDDGYAIFQKLLDSPDDDAIRLVLADWLQEHGKDKLAEALRLASPQKVHEWNIAKLQAASRMAAAYYESDMNDIGHDSALDKAFTYLKKVF